MNTSIDIGVAQPLKSGQSSKYCRPGGVPTQARVEVVLGCSPAALQAFARSRALSAQLGLDGREPLPHGAEIVAARLEEHRAEPIRRMPRTPPRRCRKSTPPILPRHKDRPRAELLAHQGPEEPAASAPVTSSAWVESVRDPSMRDAVKAIRAARRTSEPFVHTRQAHQLYQTFHRGPSTKPD